MQTLFACTNAYTSLASSLLPLLPSISGQQAVTLASAAGASEAEVSVELRVIELPLHCRISLINPHLSHD